MLPPSLPSRDLVEKYEKLRAFFSNLDKSIAIAYSGGVDSSFLLHTAIKNCKKPVFALTAHSLFIHVDDMENASNLAAKLNANFITVSWNPLGFAEIIRNDTRRCYYCKKQMYKILLETCKKYNISCLMDGTHQDDLGKDRPGLQALRELGIITPLCQFGLDKQDIRHLSLLQSLETWDLTSQSCLAARINHGRYLKPEELLLAGEIESMLSAKGIRGSRFKIGCGRAFLSAPHTTKVELESHLDQIRAAISNYGVDISDITVEA